VEAGAGSVAAGIRPPAGVSAPLPLPPEAPTDGSSRAVRTALILVVLLLAAVVSLHDIGAKSMWTDEAVSWAVARMGTGRFFHTISSDEANMGLYYLVLRGWIGLGGDSAMWLRAFSVLVALGALGAVYSLAFRLFGFRVAIVAALVLATNAFFVQYAQEARGYELAAFAGILATYLLVRAVDSEHVGWWIAYAVCIGAGVNVHLFVALIPLGHVAALACRAPRRSHRKRLALALVGAVILSLPALIAAAIRGSSQLDNNGDIRLSPSTVRSVFSATVGGAGAALALVVAAAIAVAVWAGWRVWRDHGRGEQTWPWAVAILGYIVPTLALLVVTGIQHKLLLRYFSLTVPALALVVSLGLAQLRSRVLGAAALVGILVLSVVGLGRWYDFQKEDWQHAVGVAVHDGSANDAMVLVDPYHEALVDYYRRPGATGVPKLAYPPASFNPFPLYREHKWVGPERLARITDAHDTVWLFISDVDYRPDVAAIRKQLAQTHHRTSVSHLPIVTVERWDR
jgi:4-amino-4-deoxy-L-arabinose transferase-like glycosyltransferase